jgi:hypothetical protein
VDRRFGGEGRRREKERESNGFEVTHRNTSIEGLTFYCWTASCASVTNSSLIARDFSIRVRGVSRLRWGC